MANTATNGTSLAAQKLGDPFWGSVATPVRVNYDTINSDLALWTPAAGKSAFLIGIELLCSVASNVQFKSGSTLINKYAFSANSGIANSLCPKSPLVIMNSEPGQALNINSDAVLPPFTVYIVEA